MCRTYDFRIMRLGGRVKLILFMHLIEVGSPN